MLNSDSGELWGLFFSALLSATLLPGGSELVLGVLAAQSSHPPWLLLLVATAGNTLGGISSWLLGRLAAAGLSKKKDRDERTIKAIHSVQKWGSPLLLLSWLPVIGDVLCVAAGYLRIGFVPALIFISVGKAFRYAVILLFIS